MNPAQPTSEAARNAVPALQPPHRPPMLAAYASLTVATLIWSGNAVLVKYIVREVPEVAAAAMRITLAAVTLVVVYLARGERLRLERTLWRSFLPVGLWGLGLSFTFFTVGLDRTSISHAVFVGSLTPLAILLISWRRGQERLSPLRLAAVFLSLGGVALLATDQQIVQQAAQQGGASASREGDLLLLAGVGCLTYYTVRGKELAKTYPSLQFNTYCFVSAAVWLSPVLAFELTRMPWGEISWFAWSCLLVSGTAGSAGAYLAYYYALRWIQSSQVAVFHYLHPPLGTALGVLFFREILTGRFLLGAGLILVGVVLAERR